MLLVSVDNIVEVRVQEIVCRPSYIHRHVRDPFLDSELPCRTCQAFLLCKCMIAGRLDLQGTIDRNGSLARIETTFEGLMPPAIAQPSIGPCIEGTKRLTKYSAVRYSLCGSVEERSDEEAMEVDAERRLLSGRVRSDYLRSTSSTSTTTVGRCQAD